MNRDRSRSRAILIGTSYYRDLGIRPLPADTCISAMVDMLTGDACGWPRERITTIEDVDSPRDAVMELVAQVRDVTDLLLVYYVGHGMRTRDGQLALALTGTVRDPEVLADSALLHPRLMEVLRGSPAATKLMILDCCHAEMGMDADFLFQSGPAGLTDGYPVDGLYFMGASTRYQKAKAPIGGRLTHFTHTFIDVVRTGIPGKPAELTPPSRSSSRRGSGCCGPAYPSRSTAASATPTSSPSPATRPSAHPRTPARRPMRAPPPERTATRRTGKGRPAAPPLRPPCHRTPSPSRRRRRPAGGGPGAAPSCSPVSVPPPAPWPSRWACTPARHPVAPRTSRRRPPRAEGPGGRRSGTPRCANEA
ncbi:caspase, EACC1-associated type [Streptomyces decoyicus]|uniref:caspase, EACC1-associated type n=1 Tax=Streptomyces decoyicus TaxID=249567 RepID=UPI0036535855